MFKSPFKDFTIGLALRVLDFLSFDQKNIKNSYLRKKK